MKRCMLGISLVLFSTLLIGGERDLLVIESYHKGFTWDANYKSTIEKILGEEYRIHSFEMDTKRLPAEMHPQRADLAWKAYLRIKPRLVFLGDDNAIKYLGYRFAETDTPVIYLGLNDNPRQYKIYGATNITGVLERPLMQRNLSIVTQILPAKTDKVLVLFDRSATSQVIAKEIFGGKENITVAGVSVDILNVATFSAWKDAVLGLDKKGYNAVITGLFYTLVDENGSYVDEGHVLHWTSANTPIPPFAFWDVAVGSGKAIGGYVISGFRQGQMAAELAEKILSGVPPKHLFPETALGQLVFSRSELKRWNLKLPDTLPLNIEYVE